MAEAFDWFEKERQDRTDKLEAQAAADAARIEALTKRLNVAEEMARAIERVEPHLSAIICYASTAGEHEPNAIARDLSQSLKAWKETT